MSAFFSEEDAPDQLYNAFRDDDFSFVGEPARVFVERIWEQCSRYCDRDLPAQARQHFLARFWELYLAYALDSWGVGLVAPQSPKGPDLRLATHDAWVEAVAVTAGCGPDAVRRSPEGEVYSIPDVAIQLRLRTAIKDKSEKLRIYQREQVVGSDDALLIAVNAAAVPNARSEMVLPRIVRVLFPFGLPVAHMDIHSMEVVKTTHAYEAQIEKRSGSAVSTDVFLDCSYSHVSAVLYSHSDPINRPAEPGPDFILIHNPLAKCPLPLRLFGVGHEYWKEGSELRVIES